MSAKHFDEQGAEENMWTSETGISRRLRKTIVRSFILYTFRCHKRWKISLLVG
jgi:hypothetical protein